MRLGMLDSLRYRFLLIVFIGAVLPLAIAGWWLADSAVRSAVRSFGAGPESRGHRVPP